MIFFNMWTFYVEVVEISNEVKNDIPKTIFSVGEIPAEVPKKEFKADDLEDKNSDNDIDDNFGHFDDFDFNEY